ncbi:hypothetical protein [Schaalia sp. Marseille-Q2122]|uniref:hypothetical protein n=1 Tax=Schaalia sp. Marseille-Q2122 TaxID=2736604 RepID=UPI001588C658|nr:hypothetical protein [Schaalia sp. Marseille-Q2122]
MNHIVDSTIARATWQHTADRVALAVTIIMIATMAVSAGIYAGSMAAVATAATAAVIALAATFTLREPIAARAH